MDSLMISVITPSLNQGLFIEENIRSVMDQGHSNFEHIVIDGGSNDSTIDILKRFQHIRWISEKDSGQSAAINKGFRMARGDIIGWLNADDVYRKGTFRKVNKTFSAEPTVDLIFSHCLCIDENGQIINFLKGKDPKKVDVLRNTNYIPQPTVFFKRIIFKRTGYLNEKYVLSMDFDYWRRISKNHEMKLINDYFAFFRIHGESKTSKYLRNFKRESKDSFFRNGGSVFTPYYYETFIKPKLISIFVYNPIIKRLFFNAG